MTLIGALPHLSVVIPTRERLATLEKCLRTLLAQDYPNASFVISDNASTDGTAEHVKSLGDPRIHYVHTGRRLSMAHNYEFALDHLPVRDGWAMIIGDDDGLVPGALSTAARLIASSSVDAIRSEPCAYAWPSLTGQPFGRLGVPLGVGRALRDAKAWQEKVMRGEASYQDLPMVYQRGFVRTPVLDAIKAKTGAFFRSCIPDVYSAFAISSTVSRYLAVDEPLAINGLSGSSIGMSQVRASPAEKTASLQFRAEGNLPFHPDIPLRGDGEYPMGQAVIYECYLQSAPLRPPDPAPRHAEQLELYLATAPGDPAAVEAWGRTFAAQHGLDFDALRRRARARRVWVKGKTWPTLARRAIETWAVGSPAQPIPDVYEASLAAGEVLAARPRRRQNLARLGRRAVLRLVP